MSTEKAIHQFVAGFNNGDAISNEATVMRDIFRSWGYRSEIFCERKRILPQLRKQIKDITTAQSICTEDDIVLLHLSIGSIINDVFRTIRAKKAILYHNITPSHYFDIIDPRTAFSLKHGREQMKSLSDSAEVVMACSKFNAEELIKEGYHNIKILPLMLDFDKLKRNIDSKIIKRFNGDMKNILFVGRCAPNKKIEDCIKAFYYFKKYVEPNSRFIHVGSFAGMERYYYTLQAYVKELQLSDVYFAGSVAQPELNAFYKCADLFLSMSEHEGFCIPLIESIYNNIPVMAYATAAIPETLDNAGILFAEKDFKMIAEMMGSILKDNKLRTSLLHEQQERLKRFNNLNLTDDLKNYLTPLMK